MKLLIIMLLGATAALAQGCTTTLVPTDTLCTKLDAAGDIFLVTDKDICSDHTGCCLDDKDRCVICDCQDNAGNTNDDGSEEEELKTGFLAGVAGLSGKAVSENSRSLGLLPPFGIPQKCLPPVPFPGNCKPKRNEPFVLNPPINIPYCVRIPCKPKDNSKYDKSHRLCGTQPGCYFDKPLFEYREAFGPSVLPCVPVCHLAIRNKFFQTKALQVISKYGSWNPYFTNCLLKQFHREIRKGPVGCELIPVLEVFHGIPKMAGWKNINSYECALIDACWLPSRGCFYPVDIYNVKLTYVEKGISAGNKELVYGRPKCQSFDNSSPVQILRSYHRCLIAGCCVHYSVLRNYYCHLFSIGSCLTVKNHWDYWADVGKGLVGPFNIPQVLSDYGYTGKKKPSTTSPPQTTPFNPFPRSPFEPPSLSSKSRPCGTAFTLYGGRPCPPKCPVPEKKPTYCPYKPFFVPRFKPLTGSFAGCCDINLCYLPKKEISKARSGLAHYYTQWTSFSLCSVTCGVGTKKRYRKCISQDRRCCTEREVDEKVCFGEDRVCGRWLRWSRWTPCGRTCFPGGIQVKRRRCYPSGARCDGHDEEVRTCNEQSCKPDDHDCPGTWTGWQNWQCKVLGRQKCERDRVRHCKCFGQFASTCSGSSRTIQRYPCNGC